jgi:hypothetical protein
VPEISFPFHADEDSASIRAYGAQGPFIEESLRRINKYTRVARTLSNLDRWVGIRLAAVGNLLAAILALYLVYFQKASRLVFPVACLTIGAGEG